jgi:hypothetical protein
VWVRPELWFIAGQNSFPGQEVICFQNRTSIEPTFPFHWVELKRRKVSWVPRESGNQYAEFC